MEENILVAQSEGIATVTFNRPEQRNAISYHGWLQLRKIISTLENDNSVRAVIFTGSGNKSFSAGADIKDFDSYRGNSKTAEDYAVAFDGAMDDAENMSKPTISLIRGFCVGGGCEFSMATDIRIASPDSIFGIPIARLGILVGYGEMRRLINLIGTGFATYILLSGRLIDAEEAVNMGLVTKLIQGSEIHDYTYSLAKEMSELAPLSHKRNKKIRDVVLRRTNLHNMTEEERLLPFTNFDSLDFNEGKKAFIERRKPRFIGR